MTDVWSATLLYCAVVWLSALMGGAEVTRWSYLVLYVVGFQYGLMQDMAGDVLVAV